MLVSFLRPLLVGLVVGAVTVLVTLMLLAFIATSYDIPPNAVVPLATISNALGASIGGFAGAKTNKRNGWLLGILSAFALFVFSTLAGFALYDQTDGTFLFIKALIMIACGMVGGMFAVNTGKRKHR